MNETLVTAADLLARLRERGTPLPYEFGVFITLEAVEATLDKPRVLAASDVMLNVDGAIRVADEAGSASPEAAARSAVALLGALLAASGPGVPPLLLRLVEHGPSNGVWNPARLRDELFTALVPLNRGASRRVLARMIRDVSRPATDATAHARSEPPLRATDDDLSNLLGEAVTHPTELPHDRSVDRATDRPADDSAESLAPVEELLEQSTEVVHVTSLKEAGAVAEPDSSLVASLPAPSLDAAAPDEASESLPSLSLESEEEDDEDEEQEEAEEEHESREANDAESEKFESDPFAEPQKSPFSEPLRSKPASASIRPVVYLALAAGVALAAFRFGQVGSSASLTPPPAPHPEVALPEPVMPQPAPAPDAAVEPQAPAEVRSGTVVLTTTGGATAQFLRFQGRTPIRIEGVPRRSLSELVIVDDGARAVRLRVSSSSDWDDAVSPPLLELGFSRIDGDLPTPVSFSELDLGAPAVDDSAPDVSAAVSGVVRIVSTPRGAKVYRMLGTTARLVVEGVDPSESLEFLVQGEGTFVEKVVVGPSDWSTESGSPHADVVVTLRPR